MTDKEKLEKLKKLADAMYYAAFNITTDASMLRRAMDDYHQFIIYEYYKEDPVSEEKCMFTKDSYTDEDRKTLCEDCKEKCEYSKKKEPISEDLEKAANEWDAKASFTPFYMALDDKGNPYEVKQDYTTHAESFKAGAKWQKQKDSMHVSEDLEEASYRFACKCHPLKTECSTSSPNPEVIEAFKAGAKWQKEQMTKKRY